MLNARLDEAQPGIKIAERNINNLRYADDITLMAESEEESLNESETGEWKSWLKTHYLKNKDHGIQSIISRQIDREIMETDRFYFPGLQNHCSWWLQPWN